MSTVYTSHPIIYRNIGEAIRLKASCNLQFYNHYWFRNNVHINNERGHCLEYNCIQPGTFGSYACTYQDSNGALYCEEFRLMPTPVCEHPLRITPHSLPKHSARLEPHPSVMSSLQGPLYTPVPASSVNETLPTEYTPYSPPEYIPPYYSSAPELISSNYISSSQYIPSNYSSSSELISSNYSIAPEYIPPYYSSWVPSSNTAYYSQKPERGMFPQSIIPVVQHSIRIDPHPSYRAMGHIGQCTNYSSNSK